MLKIAILEDETEQSEQMLQFLKRYQLTHLDFMYEAQVFTTGTALLTCYASDYDLLFLDIRLPDMTGMEVARKIRQQDTGVMMVFVTNLSQYAIEGYEVNAYDYILKPLLYHSFEVKFQRMLNVLFHHHVSDWLLLKTKRETHRVRIDDILYVEVSGHTLIFHTETENVCLWGTLSQYEHKLEKNYFSRCNACYLVNLKYVKFLHGNMVQVAQQELAISKSRRKGFLSDLARYKGGSD